jgi:hypothetical protein
MSPHPKILRPVLYFILILALASQACSLSLLDLPPFPGFDRPTQPSTSPGGAAPTPGPRAEVRFTAQLPEPLAGGEVLAISVLDEVTGLNLNDINYQMTQVDSITYSATFPIPDQAVVKYRFVRRGGAQIAEDTNADQSIRYRLLYVNGNTEIVDTVSSWTDKAANTVSGSISGTVMDVDTGTP